MKKPLRQDIPGFTAVPDKSFGIKGATSGHLQKVICIHGDCDDDTLLVQVEQTGPACHTGAHSCFFIRFGREKHQSEDM